MKTPEDHLEVIYELIDDEINEIEEDITNGTFK